MSAESKTNRRRLAGSYTMSLVSVVLVFFVMGLFAFFVLSAREVSDYLKENIVVEVIMKKGTKENDVFKLKNQLAKKKYVKSVDYISPDSAIRQLSADLGEDFVHWLGDEENPLLPSLNIYVKSDYADAENLEKIEEEIKKQPAVESVYYQKSLVEIISRNVKTISWIMVVLSLLLLFISMVLVHNTIRLSVYAKRFLVRSMLLVGATRAFVRRPFVRSAIIQGVIASVITIVILHSMLIAVSARLPELTLINNTAAIAIIYGSLVVLGVAVTSLSATVALNKYLNTDIDKLYV